MDRTQRRRGEEREGDNGRSSSTQRRGWVQERRSGVDRSRVYASARDRCKQDLANIRQKKSGNQNGNAGSIAPITTATPL
jgi:hypothetical protein